jgi:epoxyqueuosine reductase QueG
MKYMNDDPRIWIEKEIKKIMSSPINSMQKWDNEPAWDIPLIGYSNGADPLYEFDKKDIGEFYLTPVDFLLHKYPDKSFKEESISVISWVLPQTKATKNDHRKETHFPSERWARSRIYGEEANKKLRQKMESFFESKGIEATAPMISPIWEGKTSKNYSFASNWSERHAAYAAGLGTFGLSDGLITPSGKAHRVGSIVANIYIEASERPYKNHNAYCLYYIKGTCGMCIERCPIGAISEKGHNKFICQKYVNMTRQYVSRHYGFNGYGCGFCQTNVPCESKIPEELIILKN